MLNLNKPSEEAEPALVFLVQRHTCIKHMHQQSFLIIRPGALATDGIAAYAIKFLGLAQPETRKENKGNFKSGQLLFFYCIRPKTISAQLQKLYKFNAETFSYQRQDLNVLPID